LKIGGERLPDGDSLDRPRGEQIDLDRPAAGIGGGQANSVQSGARVAIAQTANRRVFSLDDRGADHELERPGHVARTGLGERFRGNGILHVYGGGAHFEETRFTVREEIGSRDDQLFQVHHFRDEDDTHVADLAWQHDHAGVQIPFVAVLGDGKRVGPGRHRREPERPVVGGRGDELELENRHPRLPQGGVVVLVHHRAADRSRRASLGPEPRRSQQE
jgi:hypothetical protein